MAKPDQGFLSSTNPSPYKGKKSQILIDEQEDAPTGVLTTRSESNTVKTDLAMWTSAAVLYCAKVTTGTLDA